MLTLASALYGYHRAMQSKRGKPALITFLEKDISDTTSVEFNYE